MRTETFFVLMAVLGISMGFAGYYLVGSPDGNEASYCEGIEKEVRDNRSIPGPVSCFAPEDFEQENISIGNATELECLCQYSINGEERVFAVRRAGIQ